MAFFKISKGLEINLPTAKIDGRMYFCTDTGNIYIDYQDGDIIVRKLVDKSKFDELNDYIGSEISNLYTEINNINGTYIGPEPPEDINRLWVDTEDESQEGSYDTEILNSKIDNHNQDVNSHSDIRKVINSLPTKEYVLGVKNDLLNGAGDAYDTLKELGELIDDNADAIDALETVASGKADKTHSHEILDVSGLQSALDGKAASSHGTHVSFDSTNKPKMDGTSAFGTSSKVARADHVHPTDTSRASKTEFDTHVADTTKHITSTERTNWGAAYTHSQAAHAPSNAEKNQNAFSNIKVGNVTVAADTATDTVTFVGSNLTITPDATNNRIAFTVANGSTSTKGLVQLENSTSSTSTTTAATPSSVKSAYDLANIAKTNAATAQTKADSAYILASVGNKTWYGACTDTTQTNSTRVVTTTTQNFTLTAGNILYVLFSMAPYMPLSLNVDGTGAIAIKTVGTTNNVPTQWANNEVVGFVYDGTYFRMIDGMVASTTYYGMTKLSSSTSSTSTSLAATASAVKSAYDRPATMMNRTTNVNAADTNYSTYMARGASLNGADTTPTVNGTIAWTYK